MPTYVYACKTCEHTFEAVQSFTDDALTTCPECGADLRKVFNSVGVVFKGSGFYRTDNRSGTSAVAAKKDASAGGSSTSGQSTSSSSSADLLG